MIFRIERKDDDQPQEDQAHSYQGLIFPSAPLILPPSGILRSFITGRVAERFIAPVLPRDAAKRGKRGRVSRGVSPRDHAKNRRSFITGRVAERFIAPVLKTGVPLRAPGVRIPPLPPTSCTTSTSSKASELNVYTSAVRPRRTNAWPPTMPDASHPPNRTVPGSGSSSKNTPTATPPSGANAT